MMSECRHSVGCFNGSVAAPIPKRCALRNSANHYCYGTLGSICSVSHGFVDADNRVAGGAANRIDGYYMFTKYCG